jgi:hypothetical protein
MNERRTDDQPATIIILELPVKPGFPELRFGWSIDAYKNGETACLAQGTATTREEAESFAFHMAEALDVELVSGPHEPGES